MAAIEKGMKKGASEKRITKGHSVPYLSELKKN